MDRKNSILRTSGVGLGVKKANTVHYNSDLLRIVPPREISSLSSNAAEGGGTTQVSRAEGSGHGKGGGSGRVQALKDAAVIDFDNISDDSTPIADTLQERVDFSVVFGAVQGKHNENEEFYYEDNLPASGKQTKEEKKKARAPEQKITIFAFRLALIEKAASGLGTIAFLWATVVILGGFASTVGLTDFWVVTMIILAETSRIFSRSHQLEWKHLSSKSSGGLNLNRIMNTFRSFSGQSNAESRRRTSLQSNKGLRKALSSPARFFANRSPSPASPDSDLKTPTNSSSTSSRHRAKLVAAAAAEQPAAPPAARLLPLPRPNSELDPHKRTWDFLTVPLLPVFNDFLTTDVVGQVLYFAQIVSAAAAIGLSFWRLADQNFYDHSMNDTEVVRLPNVDVSMNVFYVLAVVEGGLFLLEKGYWEWRIRHQKLLDDVCKEDYVGPENLDIVKQFFYEVYAQSLKGSVFDGLEMDLVQFSIVWLQTEVFRQQLLGARLLNRFVSKNEKFRRGDKFASDALRRLGTTPNIIERLVEMLSWGSRREEVLLREVSSIVCRLVTYNRNCARFVAVPGAMDGVVSLLFPYGTNASAPNVGSRDSPFYLRLMGLRILKYLCKDHKNSLKIGETRGLLPILTVFIEAKGETTFKPHDAIEGDYAPEFRMKTYKKSLQVLLLLAGATNTSGGILRKRMGAIVSGLKNLRDILEFGTSHPELQRLSIEILYHMAMEDDVRQMIGSTGGVIRILFNLFANYHLSAEATPNESDTEKKVREERKLAAEKAGDTLTRLVLQNQENCERLLDVKDGNKDKILIPVMVDAVSSKFDKIASTGAQILRSVMRYADESTKEEIARETAKVVVKKISVRQGQDTKSEMYETCLGLGARLLEPLDSEMYLKILKTVNKTDFVQQLMRNLQHTPTTNKYPRIRRFSVELILGLMEKDDSFLDAFRRHNLDLKSVLEKTLDSTSEVENYCLFSGLVGYTLHTENIESLVKRAIAGVDNYYERATTTEEPDPLAT